jgi:hypothetical protein
MGMVESVLLEVELELEFRLKVDKIELRRFIIPGFSRDFAFSSAFPAAFEPAFEVDVLLLIGVPAV